MLNNLVMIQGRLVRDPVIREGSEGKKVGKFTLAVDRSYKKDDREADFIGCTAFGKTANFLEGYFRKGDLAQVRGRIQTGSYTNKEGKKVYTTDVIVDEMAFAPTNHSFKENRNDENGFTDALEDEGLPFA